MQLQRVLFDFGLRMEPGAVVRCPRNQTLQQCVLTGSVDQITDQRFPDGGFQIPQSGHYAVPITHDPITAAAGFRIGLTGRQTMLQI